MDALNDSTQDTGSREKGTLDAGAMELAASELNELATQYLVEKDFENAYRTFERAADQGDYMAMFNLGCMHYFGDGVEQSMEAAFSWYVKAAEHGDCEAANRVGSMYTEGTGVDADDGRAYEYFRMSAEGGSLSGMANYGMCYLLGRGVEPDERTGLDWMGRASQGGNGIATVTLGDWRRDGEYGEQDLARAKAYYELGMQQQYAPAYLRLADLYEQGLGVERDAARAAQLRAEAELVPDED